LLPGVESVNVSLEHASADLRLRAGDAITLPQLRSIIKNNGFTRRMRSSRLFEFSPCHQHFHLSGFSNYQLLNLDRTIAAQGHKQAFCLEDLLKYTNDNKSNGYTCRDQGITSGWADWYFKQLSGQWIDITGVPKAITSSVSRSMRRAGSAKGRISPPTSSR
jgi:hypothetical protein